jgi:hypothetical protein
MLITTQIKTYFRIAVLAIVIILSGTTAFFYTQNKKNRIESERHYNNFNNATFQIMEYEGKNGKLYSQVNSLTLERNELKTVNRSLYDDIKNQHTKIRNLESIVKMQYAYIIRLDSLAIKDSAIINAVSGKVQMQYVAYDDPYITFFAKIDTTKNMLRNIRITVDDSVMVTTETKYKGWWFWKRPLYSVVKITNCSPYFTLNKVETIKFK